MVRRLARIALGDDKAEAMFAREYEWLEAQSEEIESYILNSAQDSTEACADAASLYCYALVKKFSKDLLKGFDPDTCEMEDEIIEDPDIDDDIDENDDDDAPNSPGNPVIP